MRRALLNLPETSHKFTANPGLGRPLARRIEHAIDSGMTCCASFADLGTIGHIHIDVSAGKFVKHLREALLPSSREL